MLMCLHLSQTPALLLRPLPLSFQPSVVTVVDAYGDVASSTTMELLHMVRFLAVIHFTFALLIAQQAARNLFVGTQNWKLADCGQDENTSSPYSAVHVSRMHTRHVRT